MNKETFNSNNSGHKDNGTFLVKFNSEQNGTWQGKVVWADHEITEHFRSALELINLIDEVVRDGKGAQTESDRSFG